MAAFKGTVTEIDMHAADGTTVSASLQCAIKDELGIEISVGEIDAIPLCREYWEGIPGVIEGTMSFSIIQDNGTFSTSVQKKIEDVAFGKAIRLFKYRPQGTAASKPEWSFSAFFTKLAPITSNSAIVAHECDLRITGEIARGVQA